MLLQVIWLLFIFGNPSTAYILNVGSLKNIREAIKYLLVIFYNIDKGDRDLTDIITNLQNKNIKYKIFKNKQLISSN